MGSFFYVFFNKIMVYFVIGKTFDTIVREKQIDWREKNGGSTTELVLSIHSCRDGEKKNNEIVILSRNTPPKILCSNCEQNEAKWVDPEGYYEGKPFWCDECLGTENDEEDSVRMAPLFDQGVSLLFSTYGDEKLLKEIDVMRDFPVNNYIGAKSLEYNLSLIPKGYDLQIGKRKMEDQDYIFSSIDYVLSEIHRNKIWEMIWKRWCFFEQVRNQEK